MATYVYAIAYPEGVLEKAPIQYLTTDVNRATEYSAKVYPGSVVVMLEVVTPGV